MVPMEVLVQQNGHSKSSLLIYGMVKRAIITGYYSSWYRIFSNNLVWTNLPNTNKMCRSPNH
jgi:hypothetical protein